MCVSSMEYIPEGEILVITYGRFIAFHIAVSLKSIKCFEAPATINSASLHPERNYLLKVEKILNFISMILIVGKN